ncbi:MAG: ABC transporter ATP-binding protein [Patescibacteria group bacterium]|nr:ABC transporter ATP-binding protein [Patescibacteria group bacterium]MCL5095403.1 ABC transporter ATP-binding protein [Patescibacteria group bacterium]
MTDDKLLLRIQNVSKIFRLDGLEVKDLNNVSLEIKKGEFVSIMGPSGCGKSTLMYLLGCLDKPTSGKIILEDKDFSSLSEIELAKIRNQKIGFVFQMFNLLPRTSALTNVELPLVYSNLNSETRHQKAKEALERVGLGNRISHFPNQLSGGQQQRIAIARALINHPSLILADEPTGNIDSKAGKEIMDLLKNLNKQGNTIILVTHDIEIANYAQRIISMRDGRIV